MVRSIFSKRIPTLTIENLRSLRELTTPAPSLTTVLCRAGEMDPTANWVMEEHRTKTTPTLTSSLGTGRTAVALSSGNAHTCAILDNGACVVLGRRIGANWVMEQRMTKNTHAHQQPRYGSHSSSALFRRLPHLRHP